MPILTWLEKVEGKSMAFHSRITIFIVLLIGAILAGIFLFSGPPDQGGTEIKFIASNPLDLSQIRAISKYRSCVGHDYSGSTIWGAKEDLRSMKHYVQVKDALAKRNGTVEAFAPFNGKVTKAEIQDSAGDLQVWLAPDLAGAANWRFIFFHISLNEGIQEGSKIKAGERIGTANFSRGGQTESDNLDIGLKFFKPFSPPLFDAPFLHMSDEVLAEYAAAGITPQNIILSKEYRDQNPCPLEAEREASRDPYFAQGADSEEWLILQK